MIKRFAAEATANPTRYYRAPREILQDRRLTREEKLAILEAWERGERTGDMGETSDILQDLIEARLELVGESGQGNGAERK
jgi:hypothetical protein